MGKNRYYLFRTIWEEETHYFYLKQGEVKSRFMTENNLFTISEATLNQKTVMATSMYSLKKWMALNTEMTSCLAGWSSWVRFQGFYTSFDDFRLS